MGREMNSRILPTILESDSSITFPKEVGMRLQGQTSPGAVDVYLGASGAAAEGFGGLVFRERGDVRQGFVVYGVGLGLQSEDARRGVGGAI
jgi:hypothetical protein